MENCQKTPSVIAKLMDLDETPHHQPTVYGQHKVLSNNYLQKSGSIGKRSRKDSVSNLRGSKKRANKSTYDLNKDISTRDVEQKSLRFDIRNGKSPTKMDFLRPNLVNVRHASGPSFLNDPRSVFAWEVKKQLLERLKMTKVSQQFRLDFGSSIGIRSTEGSKDETVTSPIFKPLNLFSSSKTKSVKMTKKNHLVSNSSNPCSLRSNTRPETEDVDAFHGATQDAGNHSVTEGCCSLNLSDLSSEQDSPIRALEVCSISSNGVQVDEEHSDSKVKAYQHSPNSVLETPFREDNSSSPEYCESSKTDLHGVWMQLQLLKSESEENDINPEMVTSSDDERSCTGDSETIKSTILSGSKESRDFSYLADVLDESVFQDGNIEIRFDNWHTSECMASPSVFETLEKKYGKQELWHKAERRLLFDCINAGMTEIVRPRLDLRVCSKPLRRKMMNILRRDVIEEELSEYLLSQEKGVNDGVSEKAVGRERWFDLVDEVDILVREIEIYLFDELVAELVSAF